MIVMRSGRIMPEPGTGRLAFFNTEYFGDSAIVACWVALQGYQLSYADSDHHVQTVGVELTCSVQQTEFGRGVVVSAALQLADDNGDDVFSGWADYLLIVQLASLPLQDTLPVFAEAASR